MAPSLICQSSTETMHVIRFHILLQNILQECAPSIMHCSPTWCRYCTVTNKNPVVVVSCIKDFKNLCTLHQFVIMVVGHNVLRKPNNPAVRLLWCKKGIRSHKQLINKGKGSPFPRAHPNSLWTCHRWRTRQNLKHTFQGRLQYETTKK